jgi:hypothetical protein
MKEAEQEGSCILEEEKWVARAVVVRVDQGAEEDKMSDLSALLLGSLEMTQYLCPHLRPAP